MSFKISFIVVVTVFMVTAGITAQSKTVDSIVFCDNGGCDSCSGNRK